MLKINNESMHVGTPGGHCECGDQQRIEAEGNAVRLKHACDSYPSMFPMLQFIPGFSLAVVYYSHFCVGRCLFSSHAHTTSTSFPGPLRFHPLSLSSLFFHFLSCPASHTNRSILIVTRVFGLHVSLFDVYMVHVPTTNITQTN